MSLDLTMKDYVGNQHSNQHYVYYFFVSGTCCKLALGVEESFMQRLSDFLLFFGDKKE